MAPSAITPPVEATRVRRLAEIELSECGLLILDFDGVIADLTVDWAALKAELSAYCACELDLTLGFSHFGPARERLLAARGAEAVSAIDAIAAAREMEAVRETVMSEDLAQLLEHDYDGPIAICSSTSRSALEFALRSFGLENRSVAVVGREDVVRLKPHPEALQMVLKAAGTAPEKARFVGDRDVDAEAGERAGVPTFVIDRVESRHLEAISSAHSYDEGFNGRLTRYRARKIAELVPEGRALLDLGCATGSLTRAIAGRFDEITVVDASESFLRAASERLGGNARCVRSLVEDFETEERFDCVLASGLLEHVEDPVGIARRALSWLAGGGRAVFLVPNARAMHRRIGLELGCISELTELGEQDRAVGHRRYYTQETLRRDIEAAGLEIEREDGLFLKPLPNSEMDRWSEQLADAFYELGHEIPDHCAELIVVCRASR